MKQRLGLAALLITSPMMAPHVRAHEEIKAETLAVEEELVTTPHFVTFSYIPDVDPLQNVEECFTKDLTSRYQRVHRFDSLIQDLATKEGFSPDVLMAVLISESGGKMSVHNSQWSGAVGMGQIMDIVARGYKLNHLPNRKFKWAYKKAERQRKRDERALHKRGGAWWSSEVRDLYMVEALYEKDDRVNPTIALGVSAHTLGKGYRKSHKLQNTPGECLDSNPNNDLKSCADYIAKAEMHAIMYYYYPTSLEKKNQPLAVWKGRRQKSRNYYFRVRTPLRWVRSESYLQNQREEFESQHNMSLQKYETTCEKALEYITDNGFPRIVHK